MFTPFFFNFGAYTHVRRFTKARIGIETSDVLSGWRCILFLPADATATLYSISYSNGNDFSPGNSASSFIYCTFFIEFVRHYVPPQIDIDIVNGVGVSPQNPIKY